MPCLNPRTRRNPRYLPSKKNGFTPQICPDPRLRSIVFPCGKCSECRKRKATDWRFRLYQEFLGSPGRRFHFVTLTFSDASLLALSSKYGIDLDDPNALATQAVRNFLERYRKEYGKSLRHFFVTELGGKNGRIHLHGIIMDCRAGFYRRGKWNADISKFNSLWKYGHTWFGWCNEKTINYVTKYITKFDEFNPDFEGKILVSPGFGKCYVNRSTILLHNTGEGLWFVRSSNGHKLAIPRYLKLKLFSEERLQERHLYLIENPPPLLWKGRHVDFKTLGIARFHELQRTVHLRLSRLTISYSYLNMPIQEGIEFAL